MSTDLRSQRWQDPEELPRYLNDSLEQSSVMFSTGISYGAGILTALMGSDSDFIIGVDQYAEQIAAKSFSALSWSTVNYVSDLDDLFAGRLQVKSRRQFVALLLREFEAAVRETWFQIAKANDPRAQAAEDTGIATRKRTKNRSSICPNDLASPTKIGICGLRCQEQAVLASKFTTGSCGHPHAGTSMNWKLIT